MQPITFQPDAVIFRAGDPSLAVYVITEGEVAITVGAIEVARLGAGDLFGESGVLEARPRAATATALTGTTLLVTEAEAFTHAFGMDNDRALSLVKLLCARLRGTNSRVAAAAPRAVPMAGAAPLILYPADERLSGALAMKPVEIRHVPFQVGNRFGGETVPIASNRNFCLAALGDIGLSAPHFEILRRDGVIGIRDLGSREGTIVNGVLLNRASVVPVAPLREGDNDVIAGKARSAFHFRLWFHPGVPAGVHLGFQPG